MGRVNGRQFLVDVVLGLLFLLAIVLGFAWVLGSGVPEIGR
jgi:hypothetical protein